VAALGVMKKKLGAFQQARDHKDPVLGRRQVIFRGEPHDTPILWRHWMPEDQTYRGPQIIEEESATTVVPPGYESRVDQFGNILIVRSVA
jgi:N-methylhydantoinase A